MLSCMHGHCHRFGALRPIRHHHTVCTADRCPHHPKQLQRVSYYRKGGFSHDAELRAVPEETPRTEPTEQCSVCLPTAQRGATDGRRPL